MPQKSPRSKLHLCKCTFGRFDQTFSSLEQTKSNCPANKVAVAAAAVLSARPFHRSARNAVKVNHRYLKTVVSEWSWHGAL